MAVDYDFKVATGDAKTIIEAVALDDQNLPVSLSTATSARFVARFFDTKAIKINSSGVLIDPDQVLNKGKWTYELTATDMDSPGVYEAFMEATWASGKKTRFPTEPAILIIEL